MMQTSTSSGSFETVYLSSVNCKRLSSLAWLADNIHWSDYHFSSCPGNDCPNHYTCLFIGILNKNETRAFISVMQALFWLSHLPKSTLTLKWEILYWLLYKNYNVGHSMEISNLFPQHLCYSPLRSSYVSVLLFWMLDWNLRKWRSVCVVPLLVPHIQ